MTTEVVSQIDDSGHGRIDALRLWWKPAALVLLLAAVVIIASPAEWIAEIESARQWIHDRGTVGILMFLAIYVVAAVLIVPAAALKIASGGLFGWFLGLIVASIGSTLGAAACFLIARYVLRRPLERRMRQWSQFRRLDRMSRRRGALIVAAVRLVPILPGNLVNYAFGVLNVRFATFVFFSWLCMLPGTVVLVVGSDAIIRGLREGEIPWPLLSIVIAAAALLAALVLYVQRALQERDAHRQELEIKDERGDDARKRDSQQHSSPPGSTVGSR